MEQSKKETLKTKMGSKLIVSAVITENERGLVGYQMFMQARNGNPKLTFEVNYDTGMSFKDAVDLIREKLEYLERYNTIWSKTIPEDEDYN